MPMLYILHSAASMSAYENFSIYELKLRKILDHGSGAIKKKEAKIINLNVDPQKYILNPKLRVQKLHVH